MSQIFADERIGICNWAPRSRHWFALRIGIVLLILNAAWTPSSNRGVVGAAEPVLEERIKVQNVEQTEGTTPGSVVFTFAIDVPKGTRFYVSYRHAGERGAAGSTA